MFTSQYLHPENTQSLSAFDTKNSPLALLAQTCNSIGKDVVPFNRTLSNSTSSSPTTSTTFSFLNSLPSTNNESIKSIDFSRDHQRTPNQRSSPEENVSSSLSVNKGRENSRSLKKNEFLVKQFSTSNGKQVEEEPDDAISLSIKSRGTEQEGAEKEKGESTSEPPSLTSRNSSKMSATKNKVSPSNAHRAAPPLSAKRHQTGHKSSENNSRKTESRSNSKDLRVETNHFTKKPDTWPFGAHMPFKPPSFMPGLDAIYPGYFNFIPSDYATFLKHYYLSQITPHSTTPSLLDFYCSGFPEQLSKLCASSQPPYSYNSVQLPLNSKLPSTNQNLKSHSDLFASAKHQSALNSPDRHQLGGYMSPPVLTNPLLSSSKDLSNLSYYQLLSQQSPLFLPSSAALQCPFSMTPINESCSKHYTSVEEMMDHVKLHWTDTKELSSADAPLFSPFPNLAFQCPPAGWSFKAFGDHLQQANKYPTSMNVSALASRFHPYNKAYLPNHVP